MKTIILAGGLGTRISEETETKPKPMVLLDDKPILWHVMNIFAIQGFDDFIIATGYKGEVIHDWVESLDSPWKIKAYDTGLDTQTGGRIRKCMSLFPTETMFVTYGDGLANVDLNSLLRFHKIHNRAATVTAVRPPARFGVLESKNGLVTHFGEKRQSDAGWINGGFFLLEPSVTEYIHADSEPFEAGAIPRAVQAQQLAGFHHEDFCQPMDTLRERNELAELATQSQPPWLKINTL